MKNITKKRKGSALYFTILLLSMVVGVSFGLNAILISQINVTRGAGNSVLAFYAADSGIEKVLKKRESPTGDTLTLGNGASYVVTVKSSADSGCDADNFCIISRGTYNETTRAIRVTY